MHVAPLQKIVLGKGEWFADDMLADDSKKFIQHSLTKSQSYIL